MPRIKQNIGRRSRLSQRFTAHLQNESQEERHRRLSLNRVRNAAAVEQESQEDREARLFRIRTLIAAARRRESQESREIRHFENRARTAAAREHESQEAREARQFQNRTRTAASRNQESQTNRNSRLLQNRTRSAAAREQESLQRQDGRYRIMRQRVCTGSIFNNSGAAFSYSSTHAYATDPVVAIGTMSHQCNFCRAWRFNSETKGICCSGGKVILPHLERPPELLWNLLQGTTHQSKLFLKNIRQYNCAFQMTSFGADKIVTEEGFMPTFKVQGQVYHLIGSIAPLPNEQPNFLQVYFMSDYQEQINRRCQTFQHLDYQIVSDLQCMLTECNHLIRAFKTALEQQPQCEDFRVVICSERRPAGEHVRRYNAPTTNEVAILMVGEASYDRDIVISPRNCIDIVLNPTGKGKQRITETHRSYDALQYPLIFWEGQDGYTFHIMQVVPDNGQISLNKKVSAKDFYAYRIMFREGQANHLLYYRELFLQFLVDMYAKVETERLLYIRQNQSKLRVDSYVHLRDAIANDSLNNVGKLVILPSTFTGGPRYMHERTQDAMSYVREYGKPDLFITFTCNPKWEEIKCHLFAGQEPHHRQDLIARVFHQKLKKLIILLNNHQIYGRTQCYMYTIEWQKRGLPHAHILLWLFDKIRPNDIDKIISAELPDPEDDPVLFLIIKTQMVHGPCGLLNPKSPCMVDGKCAKRYPKQFLSDTETGNDGYPKYRRRQPGNGGFQVNIKRGNLEFQLNNSWIVPYSPILAKTFDAHINVEFCNSVKSIKYVCKYINKGNDMAICGIANENDEIQCYRKARYISSNEAVWRLLSFPIHERYPPVIHLDVHLENGQRIYFNPENPQNVEQQIHAPRSTTLTSFFELCREDDFACTLFYNQLPKYYTWDNAGRKWKRRQKGNRVEGQLNVFSSYALGRVYTVHPTNFECYFLRILLHKVKGPKSFQDLKTVNGHIFETFRHTCLSLGLLQDDSHWDKTMDEASLFQSPKQLRSLFAIMLHNCNISNPTDLWEKHKTHLSEDILYRVQQNNPHVNITLSDDILNEVLWHLQENLLHLGGKYLSDYGLPSPPRDEHAIHCDIVRETSYNLHEMSKHVSENESKLLDEQQQVYDYIVNRVNADAGGLFFLDAPGGTGKTFLLNLLLAKVRSNGNIALAVASSGIAATLLSGGRTAHSTFKLPLDLAKKSENECICNIPRGSSMASLLQRTKLIVWDECTMSHQGAFQALDCSLRDLKENNTLMGGVTVLLSGDFRQTLPVIPKGTKADELNACLKASPLWHKVKKFTLTVNMRTHLFDDQSAALFSDHLLSIGNGSLTLNRDLQLHKLPCGQMVNSIGDLMTKVFPDIANNFHNVGWLCERAILAPRNDAVDMINYNLLQELPGLEHSYQSIDCVIDEDQAVEFPVEFLNSLQPPGMPHHNLILKEGTPVILLRNLDPPKLCNGTRLAIKSLKTNVLEAIIITGNFKGENVLIPRIPLIPSDMPFQFKRLQFPIKVSFAMSINKAQGQSLKVVGLNLQTPCFSHGQLYVGCSRIGSPENLFIYTPVKGHTQNVVYVEALQN